MFDQPVTMTDQPGNIVLCHLWAETWQTTTGNGRMWICFLFWHYLCAAIRQILLSAFLLCEMGIITIHSGKKTPNNEVPDLDLFQA